MDSVPSMRWANTSRTHLFLGVKTNTFILGSCHKHHSKTLPVSSYYSCHYAHVYTMATMSDWVLDSPLFHWWWYVVITIKQTAINAGLEFRSVPRLLKSSMFAKNPLINNFEWDKCELLTVNSQNIWWQEKNIQQIQLNSHPNFGKTQFYDWQTAGYLCMTPAISHQGASL